MMRRVLAALGAGLLVLLAACSPTTLDVENDGEAGTPAHERFAACLREHGVTPNVVGRFVLVADDVDDLFVPVLAPGALLVRQEDTGPWVAVASADDLAPLPDLEAAYATCEAEVPDFSQPEEVGFMPAETGDRAAYLRKLDFTRCGINAGHDWLLGVTGSGFDIARDATGEELEHLFATCLEFGAQHQLPSIYCPNVAEGGTWDECHAYQVLLRWMDHLDGVVRPDGS